MLFRSVEAHVLAGSRHEAPGQAGCAHFMEHLSFKGTHAYPTTRALSEAVEGLGGTFNASTDRESTVYYVRVPARHAATAMEVLGELVVRPNLDEAEIENERAPGNRAVMTRGPAGSAVRSNIRGRVSQTTPGRTPMPHRTDRGRLS